jgi:hypothetical protein
MKKTLLFLAFCLSNLTGFSQNLDVVGNINIKGKIQINGNSGTVGQVLMSNGNAAPEWTTLSSNTCNTGGKFLMLSKNQTNETGDFDDSGPSSQSVTIKFSEIVYKTNNDVSISTNGNITCNRTGLYHFEGTISFIAAGGTNTQVAKGIINYQIGNSTPITLESNLLQKILAESNTYERTNSFQMTRYLTAGQTIKFIARFTNVDTSPALFRLGIVEGGYISGYFITE